jgi:peptidoglycan/xylan/chitin deacetylase (PgdA/CDA1 family)
MRREPPTPALPYDEELASPIGRAKELVKRAISWSTFPAGSLTRVATREPAIALTFDDGPDPESTPQVLEVLERHGARGTFFLVGKRAARHPDLVARLVAGGHAVANHSWDHPSFRRIDGATRRSQIRACAEALLSAGDTPGPRLFRPPFGEQSLASRLDAWRAGHTVVGWDVVAEDWRDDPAETLNQRVMRRLRRGSIVLFHDSLYVTEEARFRDRAPMLAALEILLGRLAPAFRFVTVPELLRLGRPVRWPIFHRLPIGFHRRLVGREEAPRAGGSS